MIKEALDRSAPSASAPSGSAASQASTSSSPDVRLELDIMLTQEKYNAMRAQDRQTGGSSRKKRKAHSHLFLRWTDR